MLDKCIFGIHVIVLIVGLLIPFIAKRPLLIMYSLVVPFLFFHWAVNDDTCFLTQMECICTGEPKERTFMGRVMSPIYNVPDDVIGNATKMVFFLLWVLVQWRLGLISEVFRR